MLENYLKPDLLVPLNLKLEIITCSKREKVYSSPKSSKSW